MLGEVSNLLPIADKLGLKEEQKTWLVQSTWRCDKKQLKEILRCHKKEHPRERPSELKRQLSDVESKGKVVDARRFIKCKYVLLNNGIRSGIYFT